MVRKIRQNVRDKQLWDKSYNWSFIKYYNIILVLDKNDAYLTDRTKERIKSFVLNIL